MKAKNGLDILAGGLNLSSATGAVLLPVGTSGERPVTPTLGMLRANSTSGRLEFYESTSWMEPVRRSGDSMSGALSLANSTPTDPLHAASKGYVDARFDAVGGAAVDGKVNRTGDTMTGILILSGAPTADLHAATKKYVDDRDALVSASVTTVQTATTAAQASADAANTNANTRVLKSGDTMTGALTVPTVTLDANANLTLATGVVTLNLDSGDRIQFTRSSNLIEAVVGSIARMSVSSTAVTFNVSPIWSADPSGNNQLTRKLYVDTQVATATAAGTAAPVTKSSILANSWAGSIALLTVDAEFFRINLPANARRVIGSAFSSCTNTSATLGTAIFEAVLRNASNVEISRQTVAIVRSKSDVALYGSAGGPVGFEIATGTTGYYVQFVARKDVEVGPFNILDYSARLLVVTD